MNMNECEKKMVYQYSFGHLAWMQESLFLYECHMKYKVSIIKAQKAVQKRTPTSYDWQNIN